MQKVSKNIQDFRVHFTEVSISQHDPPKSLQKNHFSIQHGSQLSPLLNSQQRALQTCSLEPEETTTCRPAASSDLTRKIAHNELPKNESTVKGRKSLLSKPQHQIMKSNQENQPFPRGHLKASRSCQVTPSLCLETLLSQKGTHPYSWLTI